MAHAPPCLTTIISLRLVKRNAAKPVRIARWVFPSTMRPGDGARLAHAIGCALHLAKPLYIVRHERVADATIAETRVPFAELTATPTDGELTISTRPSAAARSFACCQ